MKRAYRVRKNREFSSIIDKRQYKGSRSFVVYWEDRKEDNARVGISVSKKLGNAVVRNRIKRQVRMMCLELIDFENSPYDYVLIVRQGYLQKTYQENKKDLENIVKKNIIKQYE